MLKEFKQGIKRFFSGEMFQDSFLWSNGGSFTGRSKKLLLREYRNLVYSCVSTIAEDVAQYEPIFYYETGKQDRILENHPFLQLLHSPNPHTTQYELFEATQSFIEITGNAFWYLEVKESSHQPVAIHIIEPHRVEICVNSTTGKVDGYKVANYAGVPVPIETYEMLHFKMFNPMNPYWGLGTVEAGLLYIDTEHEASKFQRNFLANNAMPVGAINIKGQISSDSFDKVKKQYKQQFQGADNAGKILFTRAEEIAFTKFGSSLADLDMSSLMKQSQDEVRGMFRMPKAMLGASDEAGLGRANVEAIEYSYSKRTIDPKLIRIDDSIRLYCREAYRDPKLLVAHKSQIPADREALRAQAKELTYSVLTQDESRALFDLPPIAGGNLLYVPFNMTPVGTETQSPVETKSYGKLKVVSAPKALPPVQKQSQTSYIQQINRIHKKAEANYAQNFADQMREQHKKTVSRLQNLSKALTASEASQVGPDDNDDVNSIVRSIMPGLVVAMQQGGQTAVSYVSTENVEYLLTQTLRDRIVAAETRLIKDFNAQTAQQITKQLLVGLEAGEDISQLTARIDGIYDGITGYRATRLATSESNRAVVGSTKDAYGQVGVSYVEWVTDGNPCPECEALEGTIQSVNSAFMSVGDSLDYGDGQTLSVDYADVEGGDLHPNCNCKLVPVMDSEKAYKSPLVVERKVEVADPMVVKELEETKEYVEQLELIAGINGQPEEA